MIKTVAIIQARMGSSRLPGKVMAPIAGKPMLFHVVNRAQQAKMIDLVVVATTVHGDDDAVAAFCSSENIQCIRGSLDDVLDRYYQAARYFNAEVIVRLTADCPLLDPLVIDKVVEAFHQGDFDYAANVVECTYPDGLDTEAFSRDTLERAWREAKLKSEREHVTAYILKHPELFHLGSVKHEEDYSGLRWTVDTSRDLEFVRAVYGYFGVCPFGMHEILDLLRKHPELRELNADIERNEGYLKSLKEDAQVENL